MTVISKRVETAIWHLSERDFENALIQISIAIDGTAKKKFPNEKKVGERIKKFITEYERFIYQFISFGTLNMPAGSISIQKKLPELVYETIRCALLHGDDDFEKYIVIKEEEMILGVRKGRVIITPGYITGFLFSVIVDSVNKNEHCISNPVFGINGKPPVKINNLWGNLTEVKKYTGYIK